MKKITNYILLTLLLIVFSTTFVGAETINISLESALDLALENNLNLKEAKISLEKSKLEYQKSIANNLTTQSDYNELRAKYTLKNAENTYDSTRDSLIKNVVQQYNNLILTKYNLKILEKREKLENKLLEESQAKYEIGDIGNVSLLEQKNNYQDARYNYKSSQDNYEQSLREFKTKIGVGREDNLKFAELIKPLTKHETQSLIGPPPSICLSSDVFKSVKLSILYFVLLNLHLITVYIITAGNTPYNSVNNFVT